MIGTFGYGKVSRRAHDAHEAGAVEPGHLPVENYDIRRYVADQLESGLAVRRVVYFGILHADTQKHRTHDLAHVMLVVHHHDFGGGEPFGELF